MSEFQPDPYIHPDLLAQQEEARAYDPASHDADDVVTYMKQHPEQAEAIKLVEQDGKARKTVLNYEAPEQ